MALGTGPVAAYGEFMTTTTAPNGATISVPVRLAVDELAPRASKALDALAAAVRRGSIEEPLQHLVLLRASQINGCAYCVDMHSHDALAGGETQRRLFAVAVWEETPFFTARERAALQLTEAMTRLADHPISDELFAEVAQHFSEQELADLIWCIAVINTWNRLGAAAHPWPLD
jgi:AhpD family alkylhydroperoxidase